VPIITDEVPYDGATERIIRLGLTPLLEEIRTLITGFRLLIKESRDANGGAAVRKLMDARFEQAGGWTKKVTGDVDWTKSHIVNGIRVCIGVELQISGRSDLIIVDLVHLRKAVSTGLIDVGVLVVPSDRLGVFMTDRGPKLADAKRMAEEARVQDWPLLIIAFEHDGAGVALAKQPKKPSGLPMMAAEDSAPYGPSKRKRAT
jgi:hypothetical protein